jgi:type II secretory pathway predicted ATPase ExeA
MHYYEYWGLHKSPFDNVPDPSMYVSCHTSAENAIAETLFAIEEGNECISVIVGDVGLGKTMSLRMVIDSLDPKKYKIAFVVNPDISFIQLLREIIGQLTGELCEMKKKVDLLEAFNKLLLEAMEQGKKVVIFVDEANAMPPENLEKLRLLTNLQPDQTNLFTIVLAGQMEFARRLAHPKRANLSQRIGTYCALEKIESKELVKSYVETRLARSGAARRIFTDEAIDSLWEYSGYGVPRLINKVCKLCLKAGETNRFEQINGEVVRQIGERFQRLSAPPPATRRTGEPVHEEGFLTTAEDLTRAEESALEQQPFFMDGKKAPQSTELPVAEPEEMGDERKVLVLTTMPQPEERGEEPEAAGATGADPEGAPPDEAPVGQEILIVRHGINVALPSEVISQLRASTVENGVKLAGVLAAQAMQRHPQLTAKWGVDPLAVWSDIKEAILDRLKRDQGAEAR